MAAAYRLPGRRAANATICERVRLEPGHRNGFAAVDTDAVGVVLDLVECPRDLADLAARLVAERVDDLGVLELLRLLLRVGASPCREVFLETHQPARELSLLRDELVSDAGVLLHSRIRSSCRLRAIHERL